MPQHAFVPASGKVLIGYVIIKTDIMMSDMMHHNSFILNQTALVN